MKYLVLINPSANGGKARKKWNVCSAFLPDCNAVFPENIEQARELAANAENCEAVIACGGDGTICAVADGVMKNPNPELKFGVLYAGTSPDFCTFHRIPLGLRAAVECIRRDRIRQIEVLELRRGGGVEHFFCSCNLGMGADVAETANRIRPFLGDAPGTFCALLWSLLKSRKYRFILNGETLDGCAHLLITRMPYIASGLKLNLPELKDGEYAVWSLRNVSLWDWLKLLPKLYRGEHAGELRVCSGVTRIASEEAVRVEYDGDPHGELPVEIRVSTRKLNLITGE